SIVEVVLIIYGIIVFFFQAEDGIRDRNVTGVQTCALPIYQQSDVDYQHDDGKEPRYDIGDLWAEFWARFYYRSDDGATGINLATVAVSRFRRLNYCCIFGNSNVTK